jgi:hypothetical protein
MPDDPAFGAAFIDIDEWRELPRPHRYVHGGFEGTHTLFSFYLPPTEQYKGRFFQYLEGGAGGHEDLLAATADQAFPELADRWNWMFDLAFDELGGYLVESNQGHYPGEGVGFKDDIELYRASAQAARYSKKVAEEMYGEAPHDGYVFGPSGGGVRSGMCLENVSDVWSGGVPHVGTALATMPLWSSQALATELLRDDKLEGVVDALEPGGTGDPYAGLDSEQAAALANLFRIGFSPTMVSQLGRFMMWVFNLEIIRDKNPGYFDDFWNKPGYLGYEMPESLRNLLVDTRTTISRVVTPDVAAESGQPLLKILISAGSSGSVPDSFGAMVDHPDPDRLFMTRLRVASGPAAGREMFINNVAGGILTPFPETCPEMFESVLPGDEVHLDNRDYLAYLYYHRHNVAGAIPQLNGSRGVIDEFRHLAVNGVPIYVQQAATMALEGMPLETRGNLKAKTIFFMCKQDVMVPHGCGTAYDRAARQQLGDRADDTYRMWWVDNASHGPGAMIGPMVSDTEKDPGVWSSRIIDYSPLLAQALRDVTAWAEDDVPAPASTKYELSFDNELVLAPTAAERGGIQPLVTLVGPDGTQRIEAKVGARVTLLATGEVPPGTGTIVRAELDPEGTGAFGESAPEADGCSEEISVELTHTYPTPGTYFPSFRVGSHRHGKAGKGEPVWNLARARVVVT